jgi:lysine 6-dehydrogenase
VGLKDGKPAEATVSLVDYYDDKTGFRAMERLTGWHASIVAILSAHGQIRNGAIPVELALPGEIAAHEARRRGFHIEEHVRWL